jgi:hypothetical protein
LRWHGSQEATRSSVQFVTPFSKAHDDIELKSASWSRLFTGYVAFIVSGEMAVAYFQNHFPKAFWPILNTGERAVFYCFTFLFISSRGAGRWGLDNLFRSRG